jgi:hypothetical protein
LTDEGASRSQNTEVSTSVGDNIKETGTAVITVLSCDDTSCSYVPKTTGASYGYNDQTTHTTYYPLSEQEAPVSSSNPPGVASPNTSSPPLDTPEAASSNTNDFSSSGSAAPQTVAPAVASNTVYPSSSSSTSGSSFTSPAVFEGSASVIKPWTSFSFVALAAMFYF